MYDKFMNGTEKIRALIIEDVKINAVSLRLSLEKYGVETFWVKNEVDALYEANNNHYDIIFLDHYLTIENSGFLLTRIKKLLPKITICAYTGSIYTLGNIREFLSLFPYDDILTKPFDDVFLERILREEFNPVWIKE